jgi:putative peptidoglycan lipid II flippase
VPMVMLHYEAPHVGLALATSISAYINAMMLYNGLRNNGIYQPQEGWMAWLFRICLATIAMGAVIIWLSPDAIQWSQWPFSLRITRLATIVLAGAFVYFLLLWLQGLRPDQLKKSA